MFVHAKPLDAAESGLVGRHLHAVFHVVPSWPARAWIEEYAFLVTHWTGESGNTAPEEHDDLRWFSTDELANLEHAHPETVSALVRAIQIADVSSKI